MVSWGYAWNELRRRSGRTVVTALGLAAGVGLVIGIVGVSDGLSASQSKALSPLRSVGTDIVVTRTVAPTTASSSSSSSSSASGSSGASADHSAGSGLLSEGASFFGGGAGKAFSQLNATDDANLLSANSSVLTDLSKLGPPGTQFVHDFFLPGTLITFPQEAVKAVSSVHGVQSAVAALSMQAQHESGTVPTITASVTTPSQTINAIQNVPPLTAAQGQQIITCLTADPTFLSLLSHGGANPSSVLTGSFGSLLQKCLPPSYQQFVSQVIVPAVTINQVVNPPSTNTQTASYSVAGVDARQSQRGLVTKAQVVSGKWFGADPAHEVLASTAYASAKSLKVGQHLTIDGTTFTVTGLVNPSATGATSDLYFDLPTLQSLSSSSSRVNEILVGVSKSSQVSTVAKEIRHLLPGAQVLTDSSLDSTVSGSIANAHTIASRFGGVVAVIILLAALLIAALLTLSSVAKRVREIGTLRAIGWSRGKVVGQIVSETALIGVLGACVGIAVGIAVCAAIGAFAPALSATSTSNTLGASAASGLFHQAARKSVALQIPLSAPIHPFTVLLGALFAVVGGVVAGIAGGWRAARMAPASALADLG